MSSQAHPPTASGPRWRPTLASLLRGALLGSVVCVASSLVYLQLHNTQSARNALLKSEVTRLEEQSKRAALLRAEVEALKARAVGAEDLAVHRTWALRMFDSIVTAQAEATVSDVFDRPPHIRQRPARLLFSEVQETPKGVEISGRVEDVEPLAMVMRHLTYNTHEFHGVGLRVIERDETNSAADMPYRFTLQASIKPTARPVQVNDRTRANPAARRDPP